MKEREGEREGGREGGTGGRRIVVQGAWSIEPMRSCRKPTWGQVNQGPGPDCPPSS